MFACANILWWMSAHINVSEWHHTRPVTPLIWWNRNADRVVSVRSQVWQKSGYGIHFLSWRHEAAPQFHNCLHRCRDLIINMYEQPPIHHAQTLSAGKRKENWKWKMMMVMWVCEGFGWALVSCRRWACRIFFFIDTFPKHILISGSCRSAHCLPLCARRFPIWLRQFEWLMLKCDIFYERVGRPSLFRVAIETEASNISSPSFRPFRVVALIIWYMLLSMNFIRSRCSPLSHLTFFFFFQFRV